MSYSFIHIEKSAVETSSAAAKYKTLRLKALRESPLAFSSTWEIESEYSNVIWASRLCEAQRETFACVFEQGKTSEWVAQVVLRGPLSPDEFSLPSEPDRQSHAECQTEERWQMLCLYSLPSHRGKGLAAMLCKEAFHFLVNRKGIDVPHIQVRIMVKSQNMAAIRLYNGLGFERTGLCTLAEALWANGDGDLIPKGKLEEKYTIRSAIIMELHLRTNI